MTWDKYEITSACTATVIPIYIKGLKDKGLLYTLEHDSIAIGAQCAECNTVVWVNAYRHPIISEKKPNNVPNSGSAYGEYFKEQTRRFLESLPSCPGCQNDLFDYLITNIVYPRFKDGTPWNGGKELIRVDPSTVEVWWLDDGTTQSTK